jgi:hypothetical protein
MSEILTKLIVDGSTGIETIVPLTEEEIAERNERQAAAIAFREAQEAERIAKEQLKQSAQAKLAALGLTPEEIAAL